MTEYKIYKIKSSLTDKIYIGSTSKTLEKRLSGHKASYKKWIEDNNCYYTTSFEILKFNECVIELIESCIYIDKLERNEKEGYYIKLNKLICVNKKIEGRTAKQYNNEYSDIHKEQRKQYFKEYKASHRKQLNEKHTCDICKSIYTYQHKKRHEKSNKHIKKLNQVSCDITITYDKEIGHIKKLS